VKQLVINADDFGLDPAVNAAVAQAHTEGILTSASLLITAPHAAEAVAFAKVNPRLGVGIHLCLVQGIAAAGGTLPDSPFTLSAQLTLGTRSADTIETELRAQVDRFLSTGLRPTHLDTHQHTHLHPTVLKIVAKLARENCIAFVRAPVEPLCPALRCSRQRLLRKLARAAIFASLGTRAQRKLRQSGLRTVDRAVGVLDPGHVTELFLAAYLERMLDGLTEIFLHPAASMTEALRVCQPDYEHAAELAALCSPRLRQLIGERGIQLANFGTLSPET
jgi:hopanoid biosynthesis associated protein HpnK